MRNNPVRVLHVIGSMNRGGAEAMIMNLYRNIDKTKVQFDFLVHTNEKAQYDDEIRSLGGRIYSIQHFKGYNAISYFHECISFFKQHKEIAIVHGHIGSCAALYLKAASKCGCYTIAHSHSAGNEIKSAYDFFYKIFSFPTRYIADLLIGCSTEAGEARFGKRAISRSNYMNFPNAIDIESFCYNEACRKEIREELHIPENNLVIGTVGRLTEAKNPNLIINIFQELSSYGNVSCVWVGTGELEESIKNTIIKRHLDRTVLMTGLRKDVNKVMQAFDVFLFPSIWEGLPVTVVEAQAAGLPCVISDNITKEVEVSDLVEWHAVTETASLWAKSCLNAASVYSSKPRISPMESIAEHGYDIHKSALLLQDLYIRHTDRGK